MNNHTFLPNLFYDIYKLRKALAQKQTEAETISAQISAAYNSSTNNHPALSDALLWKHERFSQLIDDLDNLDEKYVSTCDLARKLLDDLEDNDVALGLRLHYVNGMTWHMTSLYTGVKNIRVRCRDYLRQEARR